MFKANASAAFVGVPIIGLHVALEAMRLEAGAVPGFRHKVVMNLSTRPAFASCNTYRHQAAVAASSPVSRFHRGRQHGRRIPR